MITTSKTMRAAVAALAIAGASFSSSAQAAPLGFAGLAPQPNPSLIEVRRGRGAAAAVGAIAGAAVVLGILGAAGAANAEPVPEYEPEPAYRPAPRHPYVDPGPYADDEGTDPGTAAELCRRGILDAAAPYGAFDARVVRVRGFAATPEGERFRATITVYYRGYSRTADVRCQTRYGELVAAQAL